MGTHAPGVVVGVCGKTLGHIADRRDRLARLKIGDPCYSTVTMTTLLSQSIRHDGGPLPAWQCSGRARGRPGGTSRTAAQASVGPGRGPEGRGGPLGAVPDALAPP